jgi:FixJ family two-component response regulator
MASAATAWTSRHNRANFGYIHCQQFESRFKSTGTPIVFLIGIDVSAQASLQSLICGEGWELEAFGSAQEFLARPRSHVPSCVILAHSLPNGLEAQKQLTRERSEVPIVVISAYADIPTTVEAMKAGAVDFLLNPFSNSILLDALRESLERSRKALDHEMETANLRNSYATLTRRERQVMTLVTSGLLNKQVGGELGISEITVKAHRGQVMQKMKANSLADLVRMVAKLPAAHQSIHLV